MGTLPRNISVTELKRSGLSAKEIASRYKVTVQTVYGRLRSEKELAERARWTNPETSASMIPMNTKAGEYFVDPETGVVVRNEGTNSQIIGMIGDERVTTFVQYHVDMLKMREGVDKKNVPDLYQRFYRYLAYCAEHRIVPNNMNAYLAIGVSRDDVSSWRLGTKGNAEQKQFAEDILAFFASVHEQGSTDGVLNPISAMFWQKAHDHMIEASKLEHVVTDPLGEKKSASEIVKQYEDVQLPDD